MTQDYIDALLRISKQDRSLFAKEIRKFIQFVGTDKTTDYWNNNKAFLQLDFRQTRYIYNPEATAKPELTAISKPKIIINRPKPEINEPKLKPEVTDLKHTEPKPKQEVTEPKPKPKIVLKSVPSHACSASAFDDSIQTSRVSDIPTKIKASKDILTSLKTPVIASKIDIIASNAWSAQQQKIAKRQAENDALRIEALSHNLDKGLDLQTYEIRSPLESECIMTVQDNGVVRKTQVEGTLWFILQKGKTLVYDIAGQQYAIMTPDEAEALDDATPGMYFCCDAVGCKRSYKFLYSTRSCPEFLAELIYRKAK